MDSGEADAERLFDMTRALVERLDELDPAEQVRVLLALGKALDDRGDYDAAFVAYECANAMHRAMIDYDVAVDEARFAAVEAIFSPALFSWAAGHGARRASGSSSSSVMPRSGTTLVEQITGRPRERGAVEDISCSGWSAASRLGGLRFRTGRWPERGRSARRRAGLPDAMPPAPSAESRVTIKRLENFEYPAQVAASSARRTPPHPLSPRSARRLLFRLRHAVPRGAGLQLRP